MQLIIQVCSEQIPIAVPEGREAEYEAVMMGLTTDANPGWLKFPAGLRSTWVRREFVSAWFWVGGSPIDLKNKMAAFLDQASGDLKSGDDWKE